MIEYNVFTDGSYGNENTTHGGIAFYNGEFYFSGIHIFTNDLRFVSMRNVGGELIAAYGAIWAVVKDVQSRKSDEPCILNICYDYKGIGAWVNGEWKANKPGTILFKKLTRELITSVPQMKVNWKWVKGHGAIEGNNMADRIASYDMTYADVHEIPIVDFNDII